jgi:hypothetical protein
MARFVLGLEFAWAAMVGVTTLTLLSNVALELFAQRMPAEAASSRVMGSVLALDTLSLTVLLASSGGPMNPFTVLYLHAAHELPSWSYHARRNVVVTGRLGRRRPRKTGKSARRPRSGRQRARGFGE